LHDEDEGCKVSGGVQPSSPTSSPISLPTTTPSITCTTAFHPAVSSVLPPSNDAFILPFQPIPHHVEKSRPPPAPNWLRRPPPAPNWPWRFQEILHNKYLHWIKQIFCAEKTYWRGRPSHLSKMDWMASLIIYLDANLIGGILFCYLCGGILFCFLVGCMTNKCTFLGFAFVVPTPLRSLKRRGVTGYYLCMSCIRSPLTSVVPTMIS
jgi:hypothetical protein